GLAAEAAVPVHIVVSPSDAMLYALMQQASVFVFPPVQDFGIVPVEAQAAGTPVVTGPIGGQVETFDNEASGIAAESTDAKDLATAVEKAVALGPFEPGTTTARFSEHNFQASVKRLLSR